MVRHDRLRVNKKLFGDDLLFRSPQGSLLEGFKKYNSPEDPANSTERFALLKNRVTF
jgi:hypothetical protein